jgi:hypothetical protein
MRLIVFLLMVPICVLAQEIDSSVQPYFNRFKGLAAKYNCPVDYSKLVSIKMINDNILCNQTKHIKYFDRPLGMCMSNGEKVYILLSQKWISLPDRSKEIILFHELGHGLLNRRHISFRTSIMNESESYVRNYSTNRDSLLRELFDIDYFKH